MENLVGKSTDASVPGVTGDNAEGTGIRGTAKTGNGIVGSSESGVGVWGGSQSSSGIGGKSNTGIGVHGVSKPGPGVRGDAETGIGVFGGSKTSTGVGGMSESGIGVHGISRSGDGVFGDGQKDGRGVVGISEKHTGVEGNSDTGTGVWGTSVHDVGVYGRGGRLAAFFDGDVEVTGDIRLSNADCAEDFLIAEASTVDPGTVMVVANDDTLSVCRNAYDKRVAGVISGAGDYKPGLVLDRHPAQGDRRPIALLGKTFCKVDASYAAIDVGDLLTTSETPGHAMKATDTSRSFGAVIGKALRPLSGGQGLIPILIALQ